ncbi:cytochrome P450 [Streptomyces pathocidini]|uniref:cytochrome P450 n=1 Tax=Streptomyces pathocidini TaxID=1650571 RepID=UPI0033D06246
MPVDRAVPVAPRHVPVLGHTVALLRDPMALFEALPALGPMVRLQLGRRPVYVVNSPSLVHRVLVTDADAYRQGRLYEKLVPITGNGVAGTDGPSHLAQRRLAMPAFHQARLNSYVDPIREQTLAMTRAWKAGQVIRVDRAMYRLTCFVVGSCLFGRDLDERQVAVIDRWMPVVFQNLFVRSLSPADALDRLPTVLHRRFARARKHLRQLADDLVQDHDPACHGTLMSLLAGARDGGTGCPLDARQLTDEVMTFLLTGTEPVAVSLTRLFYELARNPAAEASLHREIDTVLAGRRVTSADLPRLPYTKRLVAEVLRLYHPIYLLMRRTRQPVELGGYRLPADTDVLFSLTTINRDPDSFADPHRFDPDRWLTTPVPAAYMPFGEGHHKCLGGQFAMTELMIATATISAHWRLRPAHGSRTRTIPSGELHPDGVAMTLEQRG